MVAFVGVFAVSYDISACSVLIAEPQQQFRKLFGDVLRQLGIRQLTAAQNVQEAFEVFSQQRTDLVITDWSPSMDGIHLVNLLRNDPRSTDIYVPVITISAFCDIPHVCAARDAGVHEYLVRPFTAHHLYSRIKSLVESPRLFIRVVNYFGPDRRRRRIDWKNEERRGNHANRSRKDRRTKQLPIPHTERRGRPSSDARNTSRASLQMQAA